MTNGNNYEKTFALKLFGSHTTPIIILPPMTNGNNYEKTFALKLFGSRTTPIIISIQML
jgi:hypothetical protein